MSSIGSTFPASSYIPASSRTEAVPSPTNERPANPSSTAAPNFEGAEGGRAPTQSSIDTAGTQQREAQLHQELAGKEAKLELVEQTEIRELSARDREVRAHEQAHMAVGGQHAGGVSYDYSRGPDGRLYATGGSVSIDISPVPGDPAATVDKMQQVQRAAMAPAEPSGQDRTVAAQAAQLIAQARAEIATRSVEGEPDAQSEDAKETADTDADETAPVATGTRELATYRQVDSPAMSERAAFRASA